MRFEQGKSYAWLFFLYLITFVAAFVASMCWELFALVDDLQDDSYADRPKKLRYIANAIAVAGVLAICTPAYIVAGIAAFQL